MRRYTRAVLLGALVLALAGCGRGADDGGAMPGGSTVMGPGLAVAEALEGDATGLLLVRGHLVLVEGEPARLCTSLRESMPPQCAGPSVEVAGLDPSGHDLDQDGTTRWSRQEVGLLGTLDGGTLTVESDAASA